jgi:hypothetical protein
MAEMAAQAAMADKGFVPILPNGENIDKSDKSEWLKNSPISL